MEPIDMTASGDADTVDLSALEGDQFAALSKDGKDKRTQNWAGRWPDIGAGGQAWFLLSGVMIFVGCYLLNAVAHLRQDELAPVLVLVGVFGVYELAVLGLGVALCRRGEALARRGGGMLLGLAVLLMADTTFVYNELSIAAPRLGGAVAAAAVGLTLFKLAVIGRALKVWWGRGGWLTAGLGLLVVFGLPLAARASGGTGRTGRAGANGYWRSRRARRSCTFWRCTGCTAGR